MSFELLYFLFFIVGIIIGSFLNVLIYRIPKNLSIILPRSFCPNCNYSIPFYRNIPLISFIFQLGKCSNCKTSISIVYPIVEFISGIILVLAAWQYDTIPEIIYFAIISNILLAIAFIDYKHFIIPIPLIINSISFILLFLFFSKIYNTNYLVTHHFIGMLVGSGYLSIIFLITSYFSKRQTLGYGDIQLLLVIGLWIGNIIKILFIIFSSALIALLFWIILSLFKGFDKSRALPFGTFLSFTAIIVYLIPNENLEHIVFLFGNYLSFPFK